MAQKCEGSADGWAHDSQVHFHVVAKLPHLNVFLEEALHLMCIEAE